MSINGFKVAEMVVCRNKLALMLVVLQVVIVSCKLTRAPGDSSSESSSVSVEDSRSEPAPQRRRQQWQYEGIPLDARPAEPRRRHESTQKNTLPPTTAKRVKISTTTATTTTTTSKQWPVFPPLNRRYRRIYNADETALIEHYPFMAAILVNKQLWCGGVIVSPDAVLTAAHCLQLQYNNRFFREYVKMLSVRVGSTNATASGEVVRVTELFFHPNYKPDTLEFNFVVLKLHKNITVDKEIPARTIDFKRDKVVPIDKNITFLGWGSVLGIGDTGGQVLLQKLDLPVYDLADCQEIYGRDLVTRSNFCAGYITKKKNVCNHDAGGPAVMDGALVGILSFSSKRCDETDKPAVFSNVGTAADWLDGVLETKPTGGDANTVPEWMTPT